MDAIREADDRMRKFNLPFLNIKDYCEGDLDARGFWGYYVAIEIGINIVIGVIISR